MPINNKGLTPHQLLIEATKMIRHLPTKLANTAFNHFARNFQTESWEGSKWPARSPWAVRNEDRAILRDSGTLFRALSKEVSGSRIRIYIAPPADEYANIHNEGGTITIKPSVGSIKHFWKMYYAAPSGVEKSRWKAMALAMQSGKTFKVKMQKRKFMGESRQLMDKLQKKIESELQRINKL
jgi:phage gpG-like protein